MDEDASDGELVERFKRGDGVAFDGLVRRYVRLAGAIAYSIVGDYEQAADVVQEVFLKVHGALGGLREPEKLKGWLYGIVRTSALDAVRRRRRAPGTLGALDGAEALLPARSDAPALGIERAELETGVLKAVGELPESYREVVLLKYLDERSYVEISETLGLTIETIESRLFRARKILKEKLARFAPDAGSHQ